VIRVRGGPPIKRMEMKSLFARIRMSERYHYRDTFMRSVSRKNLLTR
jgi:hypothetical protein